MYVVGPQIVPGLGHTGADIARAMEAARSNVRVGLRGFGASDSMFANIDWTQLALTALAAGVGAVVATKVLK